MYLKPSEIKYSQATVKHLFKDGMQIGDTLDDICDERCTLSDIPQISVKKMKDGRLVTADNRRLWVFQHVERLGKCTEIRVLITKVINPKKMNSLNGGTSVKIRGGGNPGGSWYLKPTPQSPVSVQQTKNKQLIYQRNQSEDTGLNIVDTRLGDLSIRDTQTVDERIGRERQNDLGMLDSRRSSDKDVNSAKTAVKKPTMAHPIITGAIKERLQVAAIDFGPTFSGYAFSFRNDFKEDPLKIVTNQWRTGSSQRISLKTSSCILFDPKRKFHSFGFDAEDMYAELATEERHIDWYYFKRFKMLLYENEHLSRRTMLKDETGKEMPALTVFAESITFLKHHFLDSCTDRQYGLNEDETHWVLTVPAIWDDSANQFMREAAIEAGIDSHHFSLALEPEAASMFCKYLPVNKIEGAKGGGLSFFPSRNQIHGVGCRRTHMEDYLDIMREFEIKKSMTSPELDQKVTFKIPVSFHETYASLHDEELRIVRKPLQQNITFTGDKLRVQPEVIQGFFTETCEAIVSHLKGIFSQCEVSNTDTLLMVGGFSESRMLQDAIRRNFPDKKVVIPAEAGLAVLKGAVISGHNPTVITRRISRFTYGVRTSTRFRTGQHPIEKYFEAEGKAYCSKVFDIHDNIGDEVEDGSSFQTKSYHPIYYTATHLSIKLYTTDITNPSYTDETGCRILGSINVDLSNLMQKSDKEVEVTMKYVGTELLVEANVVKTGQKANASFEFL